MRERFAFLRRWLGGADPGTVLQVFTPHLAETRGVVVRVALASATVVGVAGLMLVSAGAFALLMMALAGIYFLVTQVMGVKLDLDPAAFVERAQKYARTSN